MPLEAVIRAIQNLELMFVGQDKQQAQVNADLLPLSEVFGLSLRDCACLALGLVQNFPIMPFGRMCRAMLVVQSIR